MTFAVITEPTNGTLSGVAPNLTYTPAANFAGSDAFTFAATDATGATSALATASITVMPVNDPPTAAPQSVATAEDTPIPIEIQASDTDHPTGLTFTITAPPQHGTLSGAAPNLTFTPASGYFGPDSFDFQATDPEGAASQTDTGTATDVAPLWQATFNRAGRRYGIRAHARGVDPQFQAQSGFLNRRGIAQLALTNQFTQLGGSGSWYQRFTSDVVVDGTCAPMRHS